MKNTAFSIFIIFVVALITACGGNEPGDLMLKAASNGDINTVKSYLDQGVDINYQNSGILYSEETACMKSAENGQLAMLKFLIEQGADFKKCNTGGENPISYAGKKGHFDIVMYLIEQGEDVNYRENNYGMTPLLNAAEFGEVEYMKKLINKGADTKIRNKGLHTLLTIAASNKRVDAVKYLLKIGSSPNEQGQYGWTALTWAISTAKSLKYDFPDGIKNTVDALLSGGADLNQQDDDGNTVLIHAAQDDALPLINYLISRGANPGIKNNAGGTYSDVLTTNN